MGILNKLRRKKDIPTPIVKRGPETDDTSVFDWITGEEIGEIRKVVTDKEERVIAYEIKYLAGNIIQHPADQVEATKLGYLLLPLWLKTAKGSCGRLVDAQKRLGELKQMLGKNAISLETFTEMAKVTFNMELINQSESSIVEVDSHLAGLEKEKRRLEQEIYSLDIKRKVGVISRVDYGKASLELMDAYKRVLSHVEVVKDLRGNLVETLNRIKEMEEVPQEEIEKIRDRKYEIRVTL